MSYREQLESLISDNNGIVITNEVGKQGITRFYLTIFFERGKVESSIA